MKAANTTQLGYIDQHYRLFMIIYRLKIGYHPRVCDLMSGLFNQRSSQPNYTVMWDVKIVLEYSRNLAEDNFLLDFLTHATSIRHQGRYDRSVYF